MPEALILDETALAVERAKNRVLVFGVHQKAGSAARVVKLAVRRSRVQSASGQRRVPARAAEAAHHGIRIDGGRRGSNDTLWMDVRWRDAVLFQQGTGHHGVKVGVSAVLSLLSVLKLF